MTESDMTDTLNVLQEQIVPMLSRHANNIALNEALFAKIKAVYDKRDSLGLDDQQAYLLQKTYDGFVRNGANLPAEGKARLREIDERLSKLGIAFGNNLLKENAAFSLVLEEGDLTGLTEASKAAAAELAKERGLEGKYVFTLSYPSYFPFMMNSDRRDLRRQMFEGYARRGNQDNELDNKKIISEMINLRLERANLLGFRSHADYVLSDNMAKTPENVYALLESIWVPALAIARGEVKEMQRIMDAEGVQGKLEPWDWWYYAEKVRRAKYDLDENTTKPYFELNAVRDGAFTVLNKLFGLRFERLEDAPRYNPEVEVYKVTEADGTLTGILTMDFFPRPSKRGGAWCSSFREQTYKDGRRVTPVVPVVFNFTRPVGDAPALLSLDEATTLFHELGHAMQSLVSDVKYPGLGGVARDYVELASQVLENWATEPEVLKMYAKHYRTGEPIPDGLIAKMQRSEHFNVGFTTTEYVAASLLDLDYYTLTEKGEIDINAFEKEDMKKRGLIDEIIPRYRTTYFAHIFDGGYSSGYYSYKWAELLDADAYAAFKESGDVFNPQVAKDFREKVLEPWGGGDEMEQYISFRGKEPDKKYLMERLGKY